MQKMNKNKNEIILNEFMLILTLSSFSGTLHQCIAKIKTQKFLGIHMYPKKKSSTFVG